MDFQSLVVNKKKVRYKTVCVVIPLIRIVEWSFSTAFKKNKTKQKTKTDITQQWQPETVWGHGGIPGVMECSECVCSHGCIWLSRPIKPNIWSGSSLSYVSYYPIKLEKISGKQNDTVKLNWSHFNCNRGNCQIEMHTNQTAGITRIRGRGNLGLSYQHDAIKLKGETVTAFCSSVLICAEGDIRQAF